LNGALGSPNEVLELEEHTPSAASKIQQGAWKVGYFTMKNCDCMGNDGKLWII